MTYLQGPKIKLVKFTERSITPQYMDWLNNPEINRYLEVGRLPVSREEVFAPKDDKNLMFMIMCNYFFNEDNGKFLDDVGFNTYIGTCSLHKINWIDRKAEIGYMIGDKNYWRRGLATELIALLSDYGLNRLNLNKLTAGVIECNTGSMKALERNGFKQYSVEEQEYYVDGKYLNAHKFYKLKEWK